MNGNAGDHDRYCATSSGTDSRSAPTIEYIAVDDTNKRDHFPFSMGRASKTKQTVEVSRISAWMDAMPFQHIVILNTSLHFTMGKWEEARPGAWSVEDVVMKILMPIEELID